MLDPKTSALPLSGKTLAKGFTIVIAVSAFIIWGAANLWAPRDPATGLMAARHRSHVTVSAGSLHGDSNLPGLGRKPATLTPVALP